MESVKLGTMKTRTTFYVLKHKDGSYDVDEDNSFNGRRRLTCFNTRKAASYERFAFQDFANTNGKWPKVCKIEIVELLQGTIRALKR